MEKENTKKTKQENFKDKKTKAFKDVSLNIIGGTEDLSIDENEKWMIALEYLLW